MIRIPEARCRLRAAGLFAAAFLVSMAGSFSPLSGPPSARAGDADRFSIELNPRGVERPANHVTTPSAIASVGRWRDDLDPAHAAWLTPVAERLGY